MVVYIDSNIFIFTTIYTNDKRSEKAIELLKKISNGELIAVTCSLTIDEVIWKILKQTKDRKLALQQGEKILQFNNIGIISVDAKIIQKAINLMKTHSDLKPRDSIHLATALATGASTIVSDDSDFDKFKEIKRKSLD